MTSFVSLHLPKNFPIFWSRLSNLLFYSFVILFIPEKKNGSNVPSHIPSSIFFFSIFFLFFDQFNVNFVSFVDGFKLPNLDLFSIFLFGFIIFWQNLTVSSSFSFRFGLLFTQCLKIECQS